MWFPSAEERDKNNYDNTPKTFVECFILKRSVQKKEGSAWMGEGGLGKILVDAFP